MATPSAERMTQLSEELHERMAALHESITPELIEQLSQEQLIELSGHLMELRTAGNRLLTKIGQQFAAGENDR